MSLNSLAFRLPKDLQTAVEATIQDWQTFGMDGLGRIIGNMGTV